MERVTKEIADQIKQGLLNALQTDHFMHPDYLPNEFRGTWINDAQKRAYLRRMADKGEIWRKQQWRGWYSWCTYRTPGAADFPF